MKITLSVWVCGCVCVGGGDKREGGEEGKAEKERKRRERRWEGEREGKGEGRATSEQIRRDLLKACH